MPNVYILDFSQLMTDGLPKKDKKYPVFSALGMLASYKYVDTYVDEYKKETKDLNILDKDLEITEKDQKEIMGFVTQFFVTMTRNNTVAKRYSKNRERLKQEIDFYKSLIYKEKPYVQYAVGKKTKEQFEGVLSNLLHENVHLDVEMANSWCLSFKIKKIQEFIKKTGSKIHVVGIACREKHENLLRQLSASKIKLNLDFTLSYMVKHSDLKLMKAMVARNEQVKNSILDLTGYNSDGIEQLLIEEHNLTKCCCIMKNSFYWMYASASDLFENEKLLYAIKNSIAENLNFTVIYKDENYSFMEIPKNKLNKDKLCLYKGRNSKFTLEQKELLRKNPYITLEHKVLDNVEYCYVTAPKEFKEFIFNICSITEQKLNINLANKFG